MAHPDAHAVLTRPSFGAVRDGDAVRFTVWAPAHDHIVLRLHRRAGGRTEEIPLARDGEVFAADVPGAAPGDRYWYVLDGQGPFPDPASRFQPEGVHGPSEIVDPRAFAWHDEDWAGLDRDRLTIYELHVGTFTAEGTFAAVERKLGHLKALGVRAIELMPVAAFSGSRNWGYDGVALFAPAACYGRPDDLRHLVDAAHRAGLGVLLDVVYNHFGPDGAYIHAFSPCVLSDRHVNPWGASVNLDGPGSGMVRRFFIENARHWIDEYHMDGLRLDATHALIDDSPRHFLAELTGSVRGARPDRPPLLIAEDHRNLARMLWPESEGGWGLDGVWADDVHHQVRRLLAGDHEGYYRDFTGTAADLARTIEQGWFYTGQPSEYLGHPRGTRPERVAPPQLVVCLQNHDQVGNRARGDRLHHGIDAAAYRAASVVLLTLPYTPLLFMGQEWAATTPFQYFTDHPSDLGRLVTAGRRREFRHFAEFASEDRWASIPDPQAVDTFSTSRLRWDEVERPAHARVLALYRDLLSLRDRALAWTRGEPLRAASPQEGVVAVAREPQGAGAWIVLTSLAGGARVPWRDVQRGVGAATLDAYGVVLSTEDAAYADPPAPVVIDEGAATVTFDRPGAVVLHAGSRARGTILPERWSAR